MAVVFLSDNSREQNILIYNRSKISISGIKSVDSFDESFISMTTDQDEHLVIEGSGLTVSDVSLDSGKVDAVGYVSGAFYETATQNGGGIFSKLFRKR